MATLRDLTDVLAASTGRVASARPSSFPSKALVMTADDEAAISICRTTYGADCCCERSGRMVCELMKQKVAEQRDYFETMRSAIAMSEDEGEHEGA